MSVAAPVVFSRDPIAKSALKKLGLDAPDVERAARRRTNTIKVEDFMT